MIKINLSTAQKLIFEDQKIQKKLPKYKNLFTKWNQSLIYPSLKPQAQKALLEFINQLSEEDIIIIENYFHDSVQIERLDYSLIKNHMLEIQENLSLEDISGNLFLWRDDNQLYIGSWT